MNVRITAIFQILFLALNFATAAFGHSSHKKLSAGNGEERTRSDDRDASLGGKVFPNTPLITHEGKPVRFFDDLVKGKTVAINFIFTSCGNSCPLETARLRHVQSLLGDRMGKDVYFYSISVDPEHDSPKVLADYRKKYGVGPGWLYLTGKRAEIEDLQRKFGVFVDLVSRKKAIDDHSLTVIIGNQTTGQWLKRSNMDDARILAHNIERLIPQAQTSKLESYAKAPSRIDPQTLGHRLFVTRCADCHTRGGGDGIGPDLAGITRLRDRKWLARWIREPDKMLEEKDALAMALFVKYQSIPMPNLKLTESDVSAIIDYLSIEDTRTVLR